MLFKIVSHLTFVIGYIVARWIWHPTRWSYIIVCYQLIYL